MSTSLLVYILTALAAVVVVLTRVRLRRDARALGRSSIARGPVTVHTVAGVLALLAWTTFLAAGDVLGENLLSLVGIVALVLWWVVVGAGLLILLRWLPARGRHATPSADDRWWSPWLSLLGHVGMLGGVVVFTYAYLVSAV